MSYALPASQRSARVKWHRSKLMKLLPNPAWRWVRVWSRAMKRLRQKMVHRTSSSPIYRQLTGVHTGYSRRQIQTQLVTLSQWWTAWHAEWSAVKWRRQWVLRWCRPMVNAQWHTRSTTHLCQCLTYTQCNDNSMMSVAERVWMTLKKLLMTLRILPCNRTQLLENRWVLVRMWGKIKQHEFERLAFMCHLLKSSK